MDWKNVLWGALLIIKEDKNDQEEGGQTMCAIVLERWRIVASLLIAEMIFVPPWRSLQFDQIRKFDHHDSNMELLASIYFFLMPYPAFMHINKRKNCFFKYIQTQAFGKIASIFVFFFMHTVHCLMHHPVLQKLAGLWAHHLLKM